MRLTIVGWGKITPKKTGTECYILFTEIPAEDIRKGGRAGALAYQQHGKGARAGGA